MPEPPVTRWLKLTVPFDIDIDIDIDIDLTEIDRM